MTDANEFIAHYGRKGMKWGVRRSRANKLGPSKDAKKTLTTVRKAKKHSINSLTNQELRDFNNRIEMERKFKAVNPTKVEKGRAALKTVVATTTAISTVYKFAKSPAVKAVADMLGGNKNNLKEYDVLLRK